MRLAYAIVCYQIKLAKKSEKGAKGMKKQKDRISLMACSNASGSHKLPLVFIHKSKKSCCFKHVNVSALPVNILRKEMLGWILQFLKHRLKWSLFLV